MRPVALVVAGDIDCVELRSALNALGMPCDTAAAAEVLAKFDDDASGRLELPEFAELVRKLQQFQAGAPTQGD